MSLYTFYKYQGTGNDFILFDNRDGHFKPAARTIQHLCHRKFGIGADGVLLIQSVKEPGVDFFLEFFNPDASRSFCGNGSRCGVALAKHLGIINNEATFRAFDGLHTARIAEDGIVSVKMADVGAIRSFESGFTLNTGSPHVVMEVEHLNKYAVTDEGRRIRNSSEFKPAGTNVNFVERKNGDHFSVRTFERGVENETLSCGTGVTATAIAMHKKYSLGDRVKISTPGGDLEVGLDAYAYGYRNVFLIGPATMVFKGEIEI
jgi:diaminopimelate epimerase